MIVEALVRSRMAVTVEMLISGGDSCREAVVAQLRRGIRSELRWSAVFADEDVWIWRGEPELHAEVFEAVWAPDPSRGVELQGGPLDGQEYALPRKCGPGLGFPPFRVTLPLAMPNDFREFDLATGPVPIPTAVYERAGIDAVRRRFVYRYLP